MSRRANSIRHSRSAWRVAGVFGEDIGAFAEFGGMALVAMAARVADDADQRHRAFAARALPDARGSARGRSCPKNGSASNS